MQWERFFVASKCGKIRGVGLWSVGELGVEFSRTSI